MQKGQVAGELQDDDSPFLIAGLVWSLLLGSATSISPLYDYLGEDFFKNNLPDNHDPKKVLHNEVIKKINEMTNP